tara:strand:+ start:2308 stop:2547 length:240 start_codon:yes stop_codon:yes gene_type:complete
MAIIENVTTGATTVTGTGSYNHLYVGSGGDVVVITREGGKQSPEVTTTFKNVPTGMMLWDVDCLYVRNTTTATNLVGWK